MNGRAEVGVAGLALAGTALLAALSPVLLPGEVVVLDPFEAPAVTAPTWLVSAAAMISGGCGLLLARRWTGLTRSRRPAALMVGHAHALAWAGLLLLAWPLQVDGTTWTADSIGVIPWALGGVTGWVATRHRPQTVPAAALPPAYPGAAVTWTGHARLSADVTAPLLVFLLLVAGPPYAAMLRDGSSGGLALSAPLVFMLLLFGGQLRALWVTVTIGANGIRVRTGPLGRAIHRHWDQIGAVEVLDEELPADSLLWARRFERRYVLRPGPVLRIRQPELHLPAITVSIDHADQAAAVAARYLADHTHRY